MNQTTTLTYNIAEIYSYICQNFYDIYIQDKCEDYEDGLEMFTALQSPEKFAQALKDGWSAIILPGFSTVEDLVLDNEEFIVTVRDFDNKIWAIINGADINF